MLKQISFDQINGKTIKQAVGDPWSDRYIVFEDGTFIVLRAVRDSIDESLEIQEPQINLDLPARSCWGLPNAGNSQACINLGIYTDEEYRLAQLAMDRLRSEEKEADERETLRRLKLKYEPAHKNGPTGGAVS